MSKHAPRRARWPIAWTLLAASLSIAPGAHTGAAIRTLIVVPYGADGYKYKIGPHGHSGGFEAKDYDDTFFATGPAPFGRGPAKGFCPCDTTVRTAWPINTDLIVRKVFTLPMEARRLYVHVAIDNDVQVFINGVDISHGLRSSSGCAKSDQFMFSAPDHILKIGRNTLAVRARDRGVDCYLDLKITAEMEWL